MAYQYCIDGSYCFSSVTTSATILTSNSCLMRTTGSQYTTSGTRLYNNTFINDSLTAQTISDNGYTALVGTLTTTPQWKKTFALFDGPMNREAVWYNAACDNIKIPVSGDVIVSYSYYNTGTTDQYYLGFGVWTGPPPSTGGSFKLTINDSVVASGTTSQFFNRYWHVIPIILLACDNIINFSVTATGTNQDGFGFVIYNNSLSEINSATNDNDLNIVFNTNSLLTDSRFLGPFVRGFCPTNYLLSANTLTATCINTIYTGCTCTCCNRYQATRIQGNGNLAYYDCDGDVQILNDLVSGNIEICACSIITPITAQTSTSWITLNGEFKIQLLSACDTTCTTIPDGPPPDPTPISGCSDCGFTMISVGTTHTIGISGDTLFTWGNNGQGALGIGSFGGTYNTPQQVGTDTNWIYCHAALGCSFGINSLGELWVFGTSEGVFGDQLGLGNLSVVNYDTPQQVSNPSSTGWDKVWSSFGATIALRTDGTIWGTGYNELYELGLNNINNIVNFTQIGTDSDWVSVARGLHHTIGLKDNGKIYSWGNNSSGSAFTNPLGLGGAGINQEARVPTEIIIDDFTNYSNATTMSKISCGNYHSVALSTEGSVWGWGRNAEGQLDCSTCGATDYSKPFPMDGRISPDGTTFDGGGINVNNSYVDITAAGNVTMAITSGLTVADFLSFTDSNGINWDGEFNGTRIWTWGSGYGGQVKTLLQDYDNRLSLELKNNWCSLWIGGTDLTSNAVFFAKDDNGTIYTWGDNTYGQLGIGSTPSCAVCQGNLVRPIGVCFNNCGAACPCNCVEYTLANFSTSPVDFEFINCSGVLENGTISAGGVGPDLEILIICACLDSVAFIGNFSSSLLFASTDQNPCSS